jgi:hypothetical protein
MKCCTSDRSYTTTIRATGVEPSRSSGLRNAISFANADHAKSSFGAIASTATGNVVPDTRSCHRQPESGGESPPRTRRALPPTVRLARHSDRHTTAADFSRSPPRFEPRKRRICVGIILGMRSMDPLGRVMLGLRGARMTDRAERNRQEAAKFSDLAKSAPSPFLRDYYRRIAERYVLLEGEWTPPARQSHEPRAREITVGTMMATLQS